MVSHHPPGKRGSKETMEELNTIGIIGNWGPDRQDQHLLDEYSQAVVRDIQ
jgi:hypothetical protein